MDTQEQKAIRAAIARVIMAIGKVRKDGLNENNRYTSKYVTLENVLDTINPLLFGEALVMSQKPDYDADGAVAITLSFIDAEGNELEYCRSRMPVGRHYNKDGQEIGANAQVGIGAQTYLARTQIAHVFRLNMFDDDGCEASGIESKITYTRTASKPAPQPAPESATGAIPDDFSNADKNVAFVAKGKRHMWAEKNASKLGTICYASALPAEIKQRAKKELLLKSIDPNDIDGPAALKILEDNEKKP